MVAEASAVVATAAAEAVAAMRGMADNLPPPRHSMLKNAKEEKLEDEGERDLAPALPSLA